MPRLKCKACGGSGVSSSGSTCVCRTVLGRQRAAKPSYYTYVIQKEGTSRKPKKGKKVRTKVAKKT